MDHLVARSGIATGQLAQQLVRSGTADDARRIEAEAPGDGASQLRRAAATVLVQPAGSRAVRHDSCRAVAERVLVRRELDDTGVACERRDRESVELGKRG